jgi:hypothetical protein
MSDDAPIQHTPAHLADDANTFDPKHPAASAFAVAQPGAGVVADDVDERGQNIAGGTPASEAAKEYADQKEVLAAQHVENLKAAHPAPPAEAEAEKPVAKKAPASSPPAPPKA